MNNNFYVYAILDPRKPGKHTYGDYSFNYEPFYVGKGGIEDRFKVHLNEAYTEYDKKRVKGGDFRCCKIRKIKKEIDKDPIFMKIEENLSEQQSFDLEIFLINLIGRYDLGEGPLTNLTDGGDGGSGYKHTEETKIKISNIHKGKKRKPFSEEWKRNMSKNHVGFKDKKHSEKSKRKNSNSNKGKIFGSQSEEHKRKLSESKKGKIPWNKGIKTGSLSEEIKRKISKSLKEYYKNKS